MKLQPTRPSSRESNSSLGDDFFIAVRRHHSQARHARCRLRSRRRTRRHHRNRIEARAATADDASLAWVWQKLSAGETVSPEHLEANYIRRSDAEIFSKPASEFLALHVDEPTLNHRHRPRASPKTFPPSMPSASSNRRPPLTGPKQQYQQSLEASLPARAGLVADIRPAQAGADPSWLPGCPAVAPEWELENIVVAPEGRRKGHRTSHFMESARRRRERHNSEQCFSRSASPTRAREPSTKARISSRLAAASPTMQTRRGRHPLPQTTALAALIAEIAPLFWH